MDFWFYANRNQALESSQPVELDIFGAHERLLGRKIAEVVCDFSKSSKVRIDCPCPHILEGLKEGRGAIKATFAGVLGNCGMYSPTSLLGHGDPQTRKRIINDRGCYELAMNSMETLRIVQSWTISHGPPFVGAFLALDDRTLLPPFIPVTRNEEGVFGSTLVTCFKEAYVGHIPWALLHGSASIDASEENSYSSSHLESANHLRVCELIISFISSCQLLWRKDEILHLKRLGGHLEELGQMETADFQHEARLLALKEVQQEIAFWEMLLKHHGGKPKFWTNGIMRWIQIRLESGQRKDFTIPVDLRQGRTLEDAGKLAKNLTGRFGRLLSWWPDIVSETKALRQKEVRLGVRL